MTFWLLLVAITDGYLLVRRFAEGHFLRCRRPPSLFVALSLSRMAYAQVPKRRRWRLTPPTGPPPGQPAAG